MSSRDNILSGVTQNKPDLIPLPDISFFSEGYSDPVKKFTETLTTIGGVVISVSNIDEIRSFITNNLDAYTRKVTTIEQLEDIMEPIAKGTLESHSMQDVDYAIIEAHFGVAENGAVWLTENIMHSRVLPFITQHLAVIVNAKDIVPSMHEAYDRIANESYGYGAFIAGPSKTADIEQSLVVGAHGPRSMTVFMIE